MQKACHIFFVTKVLPNFINLDHLTSDDQAQILHGRTSNMSHMFKTSQCLKMERVESGMTVTAVGDMCPLQKQVSLNSLKVFLSIKPRILYLRLPKLPPTMKWPSQWISPQSCHDLGSAGIPDFPPIVRPFLRAGPGTRTSRRGTRPS